jgi:hypothetical protein
MALLVNAFKNGAGISHNWIALGQSFVIDRPYASVILILFADRLLIRAYTLSPRHPLNLNATLTTVLMFQAPGAMFKAHIN